MTRKLPDVHGTCVACGKQAAMSGVKFRFRQRIICSPECGRSLRGMAGRRTPMPDVACPKCGRVMKLPNLTHHRPACWTTLEEFVELNAHHMQIDAETGCLAFKNNRITRAGAVGHANLARKILEAKLGRKLLPYPEEAACHTCDNGWCINWWHLWEGTQSDNVQDMLAKGRNHQIVPRMQVACKVCGAETTVKVSHYRSLDGRVTCSRACSYKLRAVRISEVSRGKPRSWQKKS